MGPRMRHEYFDETSRQDFSLDGQIEWINAVILRLLLYRYVYIIEAAISLLV